MKNLILLLISAILLSFSSFPFKQKMAGLDLDKMSTGQVLIALGDSVIKNHLPDTSIEWVSKERGEQLVKAGQATKPSRGVTPRISVYFECTSCHNLEQESTSLMLPDPDQRLAYAAKNNMPFLQGSPMYGLVSRLHFYNGDYQNKYGDLAKKAYSDIREAIQLCATECAQGRSLKPWELESILAYFWTIDIPFVKLELNENEAAMIESAISESTLASEARKLIYSKYVTAYPATFLDPPKDRQQGNPYTGDPKKGELIYTHSCLHCHENKRYSLYELDTSHMSLNQLARRMPTYHEESVYQVARYGTQPLLGKRAYMPNYTQEKLSRQQMADLRAYIFSKMN